MVKFTDVYNFDYEILDSETCSKIYSNELYSMASIMTVDEIG